MENKREIKKVKTMAGKKWHYGKIETCGAYLIRIIEDKTGAIKKALEETGAEVLAYGESEAVK